MNESDKTLFLPCPQSENQVVSTGAGGSKTYLGKKKEPLSDSTLHLEAEHFEMCLPPDVEENV